MTTPEAITIRDLIVSSHHTALCVADFQSAKQFFVDFIGFEVEWEFPLRDEQALGFVTELPGAAVSMAMLRRDTYRIELFKYHQPTGRTGGLAQCDTGYTHIAFEVSDVDAVYEKVIAAGYRTTSAPISLRPGYSKLFYAYLPESSVIEFIEFTR